MEFERGLPKFKDKLTTLNHLNPQGGELVTIPVNTQRTVLVTYCKHVWVSEVPRDVCHSMDQLQVGNIVVVVVNMLLGIDFINTIEKYLRDVCHIPTAKIVTFNVLEQVPPENSWVNQLLLPPEIRYL